MQQTHRHESDKVRQLSQLRRWATPDELYLAGRTLVRRGNYPSSPPKGGFLIVATASLSCMWMCDKLKTLRGETCGERLSSTFSRKAAADKTRTRRDQDTLRDKRQWSTTGGENKIDGNEKERRTCTSLHRRRIVASTRLGDARQGNEARRVDHVTDFGVPRVNW